MIRMDFLSPKIHCKNLENNVAFVKFGRDSMVDPPTPNAPIVPDSGFPAAEDIKI